MNQTIIILTIFIPVFVVVGLFGLRIRKDKNKNCRAPSTSFVATNKKRSKVKENNKKKVLELLTRKNKITNNQVEKLLGVSDATSERYLDELEKSGKIKQIGKGPKTYYIKR